MKGIFVIKKIENMTDDISLHLKYDCKSFRCFSLYHTVKDILVPSVNSTSTFPRTDLKRLFPASICKTKFQKSEFCLT